MIEFQLNPTVTLTPPTGPGTPTNSFRVTINDFDTNGGEPALFDGPNTEYPTQPIPLSGGNIDAPEGHQVLVGFVDADNEAVLLQPYKPVGVITGGVWSGEYLNANLIRFRSGKYMKAVAIAQGSDALPAAMNVLCDVGYIHYHVDQSNTHHGVMQTHNNPATFDDLTVGNAPNDFRYVTRGQEGDQGEAGPVPLRSGHNGQSLNVLTTGHTYTMAWAAKSAHELGIKYILILDTKGGNYSNDPIMDSENNQPSPPFSSGTANRGNVRTFEGSRRLVDNVYRYGGRVGHVTFDQYNGVNSGRELEYFMAAFLGRDVNNVPIPGILTSGTSAFTPVTVPNLKFERTFAQIIPDLVATDRPARITYGFPWRNNIGLGGSTEAHGPTYGLQALLAPQAKWGLDHDLMIVDDGTHFDAKLPLGGPNPTGYNWGMGRRWMGLIQATAKRAGIIKYNGVNLYAALDRWRLNGNGTIDVWSTTGPLTTPARRLTPGVRTTFNYGPYGTGTCEAVGFSVNNSVGIYRVEILDQNEVFAAEGMFRLYPNTGMVFGGGSGQVWPEFLRTRSGTEGTEVNTNDHFHYEHSVVYARGFSASFGGELVQRFGTEPATAQIIGNPQFEEPNGPTWTV